MDDLARLAAQLLTPERRHRFATVAANRLACLTVVFENIMDPLNISACIRSAEINGVGRVHIVAPQRVRITKEITAYTDRWLEVEQHTSVAELAARLHGEGYTLIGTVPAATAIPLPALPLPPKTALWMGSERPGLTTEALAVCDCQVTIPMFGFGESYNLSTATAILLYHLSGQYRARGGEHVFLPRAEQQRLLRRWTAREIRAKTHGLIAPEVP
jgi:tRNA (guanosine-2'-O-)-methyltransferase